MNEQQIKLFCKLAIEKSNRPFTETEKELLKQAVDHAKNWDELFIIAISTLGRQ
ncbi:MAG: hypothetical protein J6W62_04310 [Spirochaetia bacterium]|nr:hypothetical protein [Spirochaetia bacterium]